MKAKIIAAVIAAVVALVVALAAILSGGGSAPHCTSKNTTLQCELSKVGPPQVPRGATPPPLAIHGVDFAWGGPRSCSALRSIGARFAASYFSYDSSGKNWNAGLVNQLHGCGIGTVGVWETTASRAAQGYGAGVSDAREAARQASSVGNTTGAITFAIDFDANGPEVLSYFQGVHAVLGARGNAYGGYRPLLYLFRHGAVGHLNWQTYAWSGGAWLPASIAPLEQYLNGGSYDNDRAIATNYGQWPPPAPPGPSAAQLARWRGARASSLHAYRRAGCTQPVLGPRNCGQFASRIVYFNGLIGYHFSCFGKHANFGAAVCQIVRPEVSIWSHARSTTVARIQGNGCNGPAGFPAPHGPKALCKALRQREHYFTGKINAVLGAY